MTTAEPADDTETAIVDGINVDAVASAVRAVPGVSDLAGGRFGDATSYLPGRRLTGGAVRADAVRISVRARWGLASTPSRRKRMSLLALMICAMLHVQPPRGPHFCKPDTGM